MMLLSLVLVIVFSTIVITLYVGGKRRFTPFVKRYGDSFQLNWLAPASLLTIDLLKKLAWFAKWEASLQQKTIVLYGEKEVQALTRMYIAQLISAVFTSLIIIVWVSLLSGGDLMILIWGVFMLALLPLFMLKHLQRMLMKRNRAIVLELPLFVNKVTLLVNAGENVQQAIMRTIDSMDQQAFLVHPLYKELLVVKHQLMNNYSFQQALEEFSRRCGVQEVSIVTNTVLLHYRRGGGELVTALRSLAHQLWSTRKALAKTLGEEASSKMVFPLVMIFLIVLIIVAAPAILMVQGF